MSGACKIWPHKKIWPHWLLAEQPEILWTYGEDRQISAQNRSGITFTEVLIVVVNGGEGGLNQIRAIFKNRHRLSL